jgi:hypothetical protein
MDDKGAPEPRTASPRAANLVDVWRFLGSFCIVWYHSGYPALLEAWAERVQAYCINWALPFFYVMVAFFAYTKFRRSLSESTWAALRRLMLRCWSLARLVLLYMLLYELPRALAHSLRSLGGGLGSAPTAAYLPFGISLSGGPAGELLSRVLMSLRWANYSPAYFLVNAIFITCSCFLIASVARLGRPQHRSAIGFLLLAIAVLYQRGGAPVYEGLGFGWPLISYALIVTGALLVSIDCGTSLRGPGTRLGRWGSWATLLLPVVLYGGISTVGTGPELQGESASSLRSLFGLVFVGAALLAPELRGRLLARLSTWGQRYSLGIFLWHPFFFSLHGRIMMHPRVVSWLGVRHPSLTYYVVLNIAVFLLSWGVTAFLYRKMPRLVAL